MKRVGIFLSGLLIGTAMFSGTAAYAVGITAEQSMNRFFVDGRRCSYRRIPSVETTI